MNNNSVNGTISQEQNGKAKRLLDFGYNLIPLNAKHPPLVKWTKYQTKRIHFQDFWNWSSNPWNVDILNWGLITGKKEYSDCPAIIVIDTDNEEAEAIVKKLCPDTPVKQKTGSGGTHRIYRRPADIAYIPNRQGTKIDGKEYKIDIRGDGGYICAPGSLHPRTNKRYKEVDAWTIELINQAPFYNPDWLPCENQKSDFPKTPTAEKEKSDFLPEGAIRDWLRARPGSTQGKGADNYCFGLCCDIIHGFNLTPEEALPFMLEWGSTDTNVDNLGGYYPWTEEQLRHKLNDAANTSPKMEVGYLIPKPSFDFGTIEFEIPEQKKKEVKEEKKSIVRILKRSELKNIPKPQWLITGHVKEQSLGIIYGYYGTYKSFVAIDMMLSVANGLPYLEKFETKKGNVIYCAGEGAHGLDDRFAAWEIARNGGKETENIFTIADMFSMLESGQVTEVANLINQTVNGPVSLIVIDTLARYFGAGDEDKTKEMNVFVTHCALLNKYLKCSVAILHHMGKDGAKKARGSIALAGAADWMLETSKKKEDDTFATVRCEKQKDAPPLESYIVNTTLQGNSLMLTYGGGAKAFSLERKTVQFLKLCVHLSPDKKQRNAAIAANAGVEEQACRNALNHAIGKGWVAEGKDKKAKTYWLTAEGYNFANKEGFAKRE